MRKHAVGTGGRNEDRSGSPGSAGSGEAKMAEEAAAVEVSPTSLDANKQLPTIFKYTAPQGTKDVFISGKQINPFFGNTTPYYL